MGAAIPSLDALVAGVLGRSTHHRSRVHGEQHWRAVGVAGAELVSEVADADPLVVFLFALFHDSMRVNDQNDPGHGIRGGLLARELHGRLHFASAGQLALLVDACNRHTGGEVSSEPTTGVCWDADRLNLWRVGTTPRARYLSTAPAREPERIERARGFKDTDATWADIAARLMVDSPL